MQSHFAAMTVVVLVVVVMTTTASGYGRLICKNLCLNFLVVGFKFYLSFFMGP